MTTSVDVLGIIRGCAVDFAADGYQSLSEEMKQVADAVAELIEATSLLSAQLLLHGDLEDGVFYYSGLAATELQHPMADVNAALARVKGA